MRRCQLLTLFISLLLIPPVLQPLVGIVLAAPTTVTFQQGVSPSSSYSGADSVYTITASAGLGGSISPSGSVGVSDGDTPTFTITADAGYHIADVLVDGSTVGPVASYQFAAVHEDGHTIAASFASNVCTLTVSVNPAGSGTVDASGGVYPYGTVVTVTASAKSGYYFIGWGLDDAFVSPPSSTISVTMNADHDLTAFFQSQSDLWPKYGTSPVLSPSYGTSAWDSDQIYGARPFAFPAGWTWNGIEWKYGMVYTGVHEGTHRVGLALSNDGFTWTKYPDPILSPGPESWDSAWTSTGQTFWNGTMYVMYYRGRDSADGSNLFIHNAIGLATSQDAIHWDKYPGNPVLKGADSSSFLDDGGPRTPFVTPFKIDGAYMMWYAATWTEDSVTRIFLATSTDGINWNKGNGEQPVLNPDPEFAWDSSDVSYPGVIYDPASGSYTMFYSGGVHQAEHLYIQGVIRRIGYATSTDGITWTKSVANPIVAPGPLGSWDSGGVTYYCGEMTVNGRIMVYYTFEDREIGLAMQPWQVSFAVTPPEAGSITVDGQTSVMKWFSNDSVPQMQANANSGYTFSSWSVTPTSGTMTIADPSSASTTATIHGSGTITATFVAAFGMLRVTSNPAVPTTIFVDNVARDDWGLNWVKLPPGTYTVHFSDVPGFATPANQTVTVSADATTTVTGDFVQFGYLRVTTDPAVVATISIDGMPRNDWGVWLPMTPGQHTVSFGDVAGFTTPVDQEVTVTAGSTAVVTGSYVSGVNAGPTGFGLLRVTTSPAVVSSIYVNDVLMNDWGVDWVKLAPGTYTIHFTGVPGFLAPANQTVIVTADATTEVIGAFTQVGYLHVTTNPGVDATIYVDGTAMDQWGAWVSLAPGTYTVSFGDVQGKVTPPPQTVTVTAGATEDVIGQYT